jgi:hypothetical protein
MKRSATIIMILFLAFGSAVLGALVGGKFVYEELISQPASTI